MNDMEIQISNNLEVHWKNLISNSTSVMIFSPYVTALLIKVIDGNYENIKAVYTKFSLLDFVRTASDLHILNELLSNGVNVYYLNNLHSKIVLSDDLVTIGSQNLTTGSTRNYELNVVSDDLSTIEKVKANTLKQQRVAKPVTLSMIQNFLDVIESLREAEGDFLDKILHIESELMDLSDDFPEHDLEEKEYDITPLFEVIKKTPKSKTDIECVIRTVLNYNNDSTDILKPINNDDLLNWVVDGEKVRLERLNRYLLVDSNNGRMGWARIGKTRINLISDDLAPSEKILIGDKLFKVEFKMFSSTQKLRNHENIKITLIGDDIKINLNGYFNIDKLSNIRVKSTAPKSIIDEIELSLKGKNKKKSLSQQLTPLITNSFKFQYNGRGVNIKKYFSHMPDRFNLKIGLCSETPIFLLNISFVAQARPYRFYR
jgi:hypothetical protein